MANAYYSMGFDYETRRGRRIGISVNFRDGGSYYGEESMFAQHDLGIESVDIVDREGRVIVRNSDAAKHMLDINDEFLTYVINAAEGNI